MAGDYQKPRLLKVPIRPLALPGCQGRRIATEIRDKLQVMTEMTQCMLQLVVICEPDLAAIVSMLLDYADHLIDIRANESRHGYWPAIQPLPGITRPYLP